MMVMGWNIILVHMIGGAGPAINEIRDRMDPDLRPISQQHMDPIPLGHKLPDRVGQGPGLSGVVVQPVVQRVLVSVYHPYIVAVSF